MVAQNGAEIGPPYWITHNITSCKGYWDTVGKHYPDCYMDDTAQPGEFRLRIRIRNNFFTDRFKGSQIRLSAGYILFITYSQKVTGVSTPIFWKSNTLILTQVRKEMNGSGSEA